MVNPLQLQQNMDTCINWANAYLKGGQGAQVAVPNSNRLETQHISSLASHLVMSRRYHRSDTSMASALQFAHEALLERDELASGGATTKPILSVSLNLKAAADGDEIELYKFVLALLFELSVVDRNVLVELKQHLGTEEEQIKYDDELSKLFTRIMSCESGGEWWLLVDDEGRNGEFVRPMSPARMRQQRLPMLNQANEEVFDSGEASPTNESDLRQVLGRSRSMTPQRNARTPSASRRQRAGVEDYAVRPSLVFLPEDTASPLQQTTNSPRMSLIRAETLAQENRKLRDKNRDLMSEMEDCKMRQEETYDELKRLLELSSNQKMKLGDQQAEHQRVLRQLASSQRDVDEQSNKIISLKDQLEMEKNKALRYKAEALSINEERDDWAKNREQLETKLALAKAEARELSSDLTRCEEELREEKRSVDAMRRNVDVLTAKCSALESENEESVRNLRATHEQKIRHLVEMNAGHHDQINNMQAVVFQTQAKLEEMTALRDAALTSAAEASATASKVAVDLKEMEHQKLDERNQLNAEHARILAEKVAIFDQQEAASQKLIQSIQSTLEAKEREASEGSADSMSTLKKYNEAYMLYVNERTTTGELQARIRELEVAAANAETEVNTTALKVVHEKELLEENIFKSQQELYEKNVQAAELQTIIDAVRQELAATRQNANQSESAMTSEINELKSEKETISRALENESEKCVQAEARYREHVLKASQTFEEMESESVQARAEIAQHAVEFHKLFVVTMDAEASVHRLQDQVDMLWNENVALKETVAQLKNDLQQKDLEISSLQAKIAEQKASTDANIRSKEETISALTAEMELLEASKVLLKKEHDRLQKVEKDDDRLFRRPIAPVINFDDDSQSTYGFEDIPDTECDEEPNILETTGLDGRIDSSFAIHNENSTSNTDLRRLTLASSYQQRESMIGIGFVDQKRREMVVEPDRDRIAQLKARNDMQHPAHRSSYFTEVQEYESPSANESALKKGKENEGQGTLKKVKHRISSVLRPNRNNGN